MQPLIGLFLTAKCHHFDNKSAILVNFITKRYYLKQKSQNYAKCYKILEIPDDSDQESVRKAFIKLCKKYHPDSGESTADEKKFHEVESAYRTLQNKFAEERWNVNEGIGEYGLYYKEKKSKDEKPEVFDIKHTAPQHRQYLSYDGIGSGTPSQRQKQYTKYRTMVAAENVSDHQIKKFSNASESAESSLVIKDKTAAKKIKTRYGMERLVEDLIQESMAKGHFDNLKGHGKPLQHSSYNPYVDFVTHKLNEILIDNGFTPEWILLQKEISEEIELIRKTLTMERSKLGPLPLSFADEKTWDQVIRDLQGSVTSLNQKINKFNLVVPMLEKQKLYFNLDKESSVILNSGSFSTKPKVKTKEEEKPTGDFLGSFFSFFK